MKPYANSGGSTRNSRENQRGFFAVGLPSLRNVSALRGPAASRSVSLVAFVVSHDITFFLRISGDRRFCASPLTPPGLVAQQVVCLKNRGFVDSSMENGRIPAM
jgi:hypothetical protein